MTSEIVNKGAVPPGPKGLKLVRTMLALGRDPLPNLFKLTAEYGDVVHVGLGWFHLYFLNHPDYLYELLVRQASKLRKPRSVSRPIAEFLGSGLLVSEGDYWREHRRIVQPAFHHKRVEGYGQVMTICIQETLNRWKSGEVYDIDHEMMCMTLPMVTRSLFHTDIGYAVDDVAEAVKIIQKISYRQGQSPLPLWVPLPNHVRKQQAMERLDRIVLRMIDAGRKAGQDGDDLLSMLLNVVDENGEHLTNQQVRDEVMTVLLAGHESTANALTWMWYLVSQNPEVQDKLQRELDAVLDGKMPSVEDLKRLPYNHMIVKEALRLYPPAWALPREPVEDVMIGGYRIPKGSLVIGVPFTIQRDGRYYDDPDQFIPERFESDQEKKVPLYAYIPFGSGPRFCIGNTFALMTMQLILASVHQHYRFEPDGDEPVSTDPLLTLRPRHGMFMRIIRR
jgi:cytochrome P450